jgi:LmbE family N-acetylglucosaminyl deacetylase
MNKNILVFSPHPDDETLGVGGTIAKKIADGFQVYVIIITDGRNAFSEVFNIQSHPTPAELRTMRKNEVLNALKILGVPRENIRFLGIEDGKLQDSESAALKEIIKVLKEIDPEEVYFTYSKDVNPDHRAANKIVQQALNKTGLTPQRFQYSIRQPYSRLSPMIDSLVNPLKRNLLSVDISEYLTLKREAVKQFISQVSLISENQERAMLPPERLAQHLKDCETFYRCS